MREVLITPDNIQHVRLDTNSERKHQLAMVSLAQCIEREDEWAEEHYWERAAAVYPFCSDDELHHVPNPTKRH